MKAKRVKKTCLLPDFCTIEMAHVTLAHIYWSELVTRPQPYAKQACSPQLSGRPQGQVLMVDRTFRGWVVRPATQPSSVGADPMQTQYRQSSLWSPARDQELPALQGNVPKILY